MYAFRRRLRAWPGSGGRGSAAGQGICLYASRHRLRARAGGGGGGCGWIGSCSLRLPPLQRRAWPGGGGGGERSWTESLLCTPPAADFGPDPEAAEDQRPTRRAGPAGAAQEEHLPLLLRIATVSGLLLDILAFGLVSVNHWSQSVRRLDDTLLPRRLWRAGRGGAGKRDPHCCFYHSPWQLLGWRLG